jgi:large subunit ribosomal protein L10
MPRPDKVEKVSAIKERFQSNAAVVVTEYRGLTVEDLAELRKSLRGSGVELKVTKNTLMRIAVRETDYEPILSLIEGPVALAYVREDVVKAAQSLVAYARKNPKLKIRGGLVEGKVVQGPDVRTIATLPPREVLLAQLVGTIKAPLNNLVGVLSGPTRGLVQVLNAVREQKEAAA